MKNFPPRMDTRNSAAHPIPALVANLHDDGRDHHISAQPIVNNRLSPLHAQKPPIYIQQASAIVQDIFNQMALKDSPPVNDRAPVSDSIFSAPEVINKQCHAGLMLPPSARAPNLGPFSVACGGDDGSSRTEIAGASSFGSATTAGAGSSSLPPSGRVPSVHHQNSMAGLGPAPSDPTMIPAMKMGHVHWQALASWTFEHLGITIVPYEIEANCLLAQLVSPSASLVPSPCKHGKSQNLYSRKKILSFLKPKGNAQAKREPTIRLQMFGSEYARHLSTSVLAPEKLTKPPIQRNKRKMSTRNILPINLEDADAATLAGAILDLAVTVDNKSPPDGYYRISQTATRKEFMLGYDGGSSKAKKSPMYLHVKKEPDWDKAAQRPCVTALALIFPDRSEFVPPGFSVVKIDNKPANLGGGTLANERVHLCFRRSREGNPLTGLVPLSTIHQETVPEGYTVIERTPRNHTAVLYTSGCFLAYRQRLANLETLRPFPLVESLMNGRNVSAHTTRLKCSRSDTAEDTKPLLLAYYCTGATVVAADVGRFHIMDRSTHSLLSPSSVTNRLALIESSRLNDKVKREDTTETTFKGDWDESTRGNGDESAAQSCFRMNHSAISFGSAVLTFATSHRLSPCAFRQEIDPTLPELDFIPSIETPGCRTESDINPTRLAARTAVLTPILTACYTRHGGTALVAVEGLLKLVKGKQFFRDDVKLSETSDSNSSKRLTLLDMAIQVVCDLTTTGASEILFSVCVEFVDEAVRFAKGQLQTRTIGHVLRFYLFVFLFEASVRSGTFELSNPSWQTAGEKESGNVVAEVSILDDPREDGRNFLPGGAPQRAVLGIKELISLSIVHLGKVDVTDILRSARCTSEGDAAVEEEQEPMSFLDNLLSSVVDDAVDQVERANFIQLAVCQLYRSGGSELFWHEMVNICGRGLFAKDDRLCESGRSTYILLFAVLSCLVKLSSGQLRINRMRASMLPRDRASKLLGLELILHFLECWSDEQEAVGVLNATNNVSTIKSVRTFVFCIRRMVVPCLLENTRHALEDPQIFQRVVRIVSELWSSPIYRSHCKVELGVLMEHYGVRILNLGPQFLFSTKLDLSPECVCVSLLSQQVDLLKEITNWFSNDPKDVIEIYLNFEADTFEEVSGPIQLLQGKELKIIQKLCVGLSNIAEQASELIGDQIRENQSEILSAAKRKTSELSTVISLHRRLVHSDKNLVTGATHALRTASLEAMEMIVKSLAINAAMAMGNEFSSLLLSWTLLDSPLLDDSSRSPSVGSGSGYGELSHATKNIPDITLKYYPDEAAIERRSQTLDRRPSSKEVLETAAEIADKKTLKKAVEYLIACNVLTPSPREIATYLRVNQEKWDPVELGIYLGEGGTSSIDAEFFNSIRSLYVRAVSFVGMNVEQG